MDIILIKLLEDQISSLDFLLKDLDLEVFNKPIIPGKWSIQEHLAHLGRYQEIFLERIVVILEKETPHLNRYRANEDDGFKSWCQKETNEIIKKLKQDRQKIIHLLDSLDESSLKRTGIHPVFGAMNIEEWTHFFLLHETHHQYSIFSLKRRFLKPI